MIVLETILISVILKTRSTEIKSDNQKGAASHSVSPKVNSKKTKLSNNKKLRKILCLKRQSVQKQVWKISESLHHTSDVKMPIITSQDDIDLLKIYQDRKYVQGKKRRGSFLSDNEILANKKCGEEKKPRYLEVRGLRFCPESGMYLDRDREAALTIARLHCMEMLSLPRPSPFCRAKRAMSS